MSSWTSLDVLCTMYGALTLLKLGQWLVIWRKQQLEAVRSTAGTGTTHNHIQYAPSTDAILYVFEVLLGIGNPAKVPRKEFRVVTDPWVKEYNRRVTKNNEGRRHPKTFTSLRSALHDFYREFTQETSSYMVPFTHSTLFAFQAHPLGVASMLELLGLVLVLPWLLMWEVFVRRGRAEALLCRIAASGTANEVYVVSCKEGISFDAALHKYPWVRGVFSSNQLHPLIGRSVCPLYKREIQLPNDVMDFDIMVIPNPSGTLLLRQRRATWLGQIYEELYPSYLVTLAIGVYMICVHGLANVTIIPYMVVFYALRWMADRSMGIVWYSHFQWLL